MPIEMPFHPVIERPCFRLVGGAKEPMHEGMHSGGKVEGHLDSLDDDLPGFFLGEGFDGVPFGTIPVFGAFHNLTQKSDDRGEPGFLPCQFDDAVAFEVTAMEKIVSRFSLMYQ